MCMCDLSQPTCVSSTINFFKKKKKLSEPLYYFILKTELGFGTYSDDKGCVTDKSAMQ